MSVRPDEEEYEYVRRQSRADEDQAYYADLEQQDDDEQDDEEEE